MTCATCGQALELASIARVNFWLCSRCAAFSVAGGNLTLEQTVEESEAVRLRLLSLKYVDQVRRTRGRERLDLEAAERGREWVAHWIGVPASEWPSA